jgi:uncharacterized protein (TIGR02147 family)
MLKLRLMNSTYQEILASELLNRKRLNSKFSLRALARDLDVSAGHLSSIIHGKKSLTRMQASKIVAKLGLSPNDKTRFLASAFPEILQTKTSREIKMSLIREDEFRLISEWYHFAILSLGATSPNTAHPGWIAKRLGISEIQAIDGLGRLKRLKLITTFKDGSFKQTGRPLTTTDDIPSAAIKRYHKQNLELAMIKLDSISVDKREYGAMTMAINPAKLKKAKRMIRDFQDQLWQELRVGKKKLVYTFSAQFFPVSQESGVSE